MADRETDEALPGYLSTQFQGWVDWDAREHGWSRDPDASMKVSCLKLRKWSENSNTLCLFLVRVSDVPGSFQRIASFRTMDALYRFKMLIKINLFEGCEMEEVRIV
jgi:hypothetical protein